MPLIKSHSDEDRGKNIDELINSGYEPKQAAAIAYAHQRKYKKMSEGGEVESAEIESQTGDGPARGVFELQEESHEENNRPEHYNPLVAAIRGEDHSDNGDVDSDVGEDIVSLPESYFAERAAEAIRKKKEKAIKP